MRYSKYPKPHRPGGFLLLFLSCLLSMLTACSGNADSKAPATVTPGSSISCSSHSTNPVALKMTYGSEKEAWITNVVKDFNSRQITACDGPITVQATATGSGQSMQAILNGQDKPDIWSPAGSVWLTMLNAKWQEKNGKQLIGTGASDSPSLVNSPVVIAMWKPQAEALGWPQKAIGWSDIARLSTDPQGWKTYGHAEFGQFKFGHTHPEYSNSGLDAVIAMNYAATNKQRGLTNADVTDTQSRNFVAEVESSVIHYGDSTGFFADKMFQNGPSYLSATVMYESLVVEANDKTKYPDLPYPVVAIYPKEGTFQSDHPFAILQADWVTPAKKAAAQAFRDFLLAPEQQSKALGYGFRPAKGTINAPLDSGHGVDPKQPGNVLQIPNANVVQTILTDWHEQQRRVDVTLVLDRSGSMNDPINGIKKIDASRQGLKQFVNMLNDADQLDFTLFSDTIDTVSPMSALGPKRNNLLTQIDNVIASGSTRLYDAIDQSVQDLKNVQSKHIKAVIVLSDGEDTQSNTILETLLSKIKVSGEDAGTGIKVFTIAYGSEAKTDVLKQIADVTGGQEYQGDPQHIVEIYNEISKFF
jgi:Ca-activated chloride channel family protein